MSTLTPRPVVPTSHAASKFVGLTYIEALANTGLVRYHVPSSLREHVDYITPGITLREVTGVGNRSGGSIQKRFANGLPPILEPIAVPLEQLLGQLLDFCDVAITPQCIRGKSQACSKQGCILTLFCRYVQYYRGHLSYPGQRAGNL